MKLSVIMSVYNGERYLTSAIDSVLEQTFRDFEFFIVDDGSDDGTAAILAEYAESDARIRVVTHLENRGLTASLNELLGMVQGEYLARMDADDVSLPERFAKQIAWLDAHPVCGVLGTSYWVIDEAGRRQLACHFENDHDYLCWYLCFQNPLAHPSIMGRTSLFHEAGGYRGSYRYGQDFDLWWRLSSKTRLGCLPEALLELRRHPSSVSQRHKFDQMLVKHRILAEMLPRLGIDSVAQVLPLTGERHSVELRSELIRRVLASFAENKELSARTRSLIRQDAAARMGLIWLRAPVSAAAWQGMLEGLRWDPLVGLRGVVSLLGRRLAQEATNPILR